MNTVVRAAEDEVGRAALPVPPERDVPCAPKQLSLGTAQLLGRGVKQLQYRAQLGRAQGSRPLAKTFQLNRMPQALERLLHGLGQQLPGHRPVRALGVRPVVGDRSRGDAKI